MIIMMSLLAVVLIVLGFPIWLILGLTSFVGLYFFLGVPLSIISQTMFGSINYFVLVAIPLFIFTGNLMGTGSIAKRLIDWIKSIIGRLPGGMAITTVGVNEVFGAMSGSAPATTASIGRVLYPALRSDGYGVYFSSGLIASTGALSSIVPPSINMILFSATASVSVAQVFLAGVVPSLLAAIIIGSYCIWYARRNVITQQSENTECANDMLENSSADGPSVEESNGSGRMKMIMGETWKASLSLGIPLIIFGGIYSGLATPTEVAALACLYAFVLSVVVYRDTYISDIIASANAAAKVTASIFIIMAAAGLFAWVLSVGQIPQELVQQIESSQLPWWGVLILINVLLLIAGALVDPVSAIVILTPILVPIVTELGLDPIHFGVIMVVNMAIGMFTPPFGLNLFVAMRVFNLPMGVVVKGLVPFFSLYIVVLCLITYVPSISLWLPSLVYR